MNIWLSETIVRAVGWTLVHFVWEGLVIVALLATALRVMRRSPAHWRYLVGCAAMAAMAVAPLVTFQLVLGQGALPQLSAMTTEVPQTMPVESPSLADASAPASDVTLPITRANTPSLVGDDVRSLKSIRLFGYQLQIPYAVSRLIDELHRLEAWLPWLVTGWLVGVCLLSCRLLAGWWQVRRLARTACGSAGEVWEHKLAQLARRLGVNRSIRLLQSALVEVPTVVGWLRPVILLPASCLTGLSPGQLEAILAHELAHIRRHDYLINLLQSAVETLLFYHPAVWWVSRKVREERENCCDDLAVAVSGDRVGYARALATLEELRPASAQLALAASGAPLLRRIRRLAGQPERRAGRASWPVVGIVLLLGLGLLAFGTHEHRAQAAEQGTVPVITNHALPTNTNSADVGPVVSNAVDVARQAQMQAMDIQQIVTGAGGSVLDPTMPHFNVVQQVSANSPVPDSYARPTNVVNTNPGRKLIFDQLSRIRVESLDYRDLPLKDVLDDLAAKAKARDPDGKGINFFFSHEASAPFNNPTVDANGNLVGSPDPNQPDASSAKVHVSLQYVTVAQALDAILKTASPPVKYSVLDYGIMFSLRTNEPVPLEIRNFKVDRDTFLTNVLSMTGASSVDGMSEDQSASVDIITVSGNGINHNGGFGGGPNETTNYGSIPFVPSVTRGSRVEQQVRAFFGSIGIDLSTNSGKAVIWNDRKGMLTIRATAEDLDLIEKTLQVINPPAGVTEGTLNNVPAAPRNPTAAGANANLPAIIARLDQIRVDAIYSGMPLRDVLDDLHRRTQAADPAGQGINFVFNRADPNPASADSAPVTVRLALRDAPVSQVLGAIAGGSSRPVGYSVMDYGVAFSLAPTNQPPELQVRNFVVNNGGFASALHAATGTELSSGREPVEAAVRKYFAAKGIDLSTSTSKAVIWNGRKEMLTIRATVGDLDAIQQEIRKQDESPTGSPSAGAPAPLEIRSFKIDGKTFQNGLTGVSSTAMGGFSRGGGASVEKVTISGNGISPNGGFGGPNGMTNSGTTPVARAGQVEENVRAFFSAAGIDLSTNAGKAVIWNERRGMLTIKATADDLDVIEKALQVVNTLPPMVNIKVKFVEITQNDTRTFGFPWPPGLPFSAESATNSAVTNASPLGFFPGAMNVPPGGTVTPTAVVTVVAPPAPNGPPPSGYQWQLGGVAPGPGTASNAAAQNQQNAPRLATITGILTPQQYATVLQALQQRAGTEILTVQEVTTESGRQAQMRAVDVKQIVTFAGTTTGPTVPAFNPQTNTVSLGPELDVVPYITADQNAVQMALIPSITEFVGYTNSGQFVPQVLPLPHFRLRQVVTSVTVWDGQTVALGGGLSTETNRVMDKVPLLGDLPVIGRLFRSESTLPVKRNLMIFVTVTLVNPDGTRFHSDDELNALRSSPPTRQGTNE